MGLPLIETEFGLAGRPSETALSQAPRALCHPKSPMFSDGLCEMCFETRAKHLSAAMTLDAPSKEEADARTALAKLHTHVEYVKGLGRAATAIMEHHLPAYAALHFRAAQVAAEDGDAGPAQWALQHIKPAGAPAVVEAAKPSGWGQGGGAAVQVMVGVTLGGLPPGTGRGEVIEAEIKED